MGGGPGAYGDLVIHPLEPIFDAGSSVLVLGTMPSPASRSSGFYYMHPQNRFWPVLAGVFEPARLAAGRVPETVAERRAFALKHGVALWDVLYSCRILGAGDSTIRDPVANDLSRILAEVPIRMICTTGRKAKNLYDRFCRIGTGREAVYLPSPSSANCAVPLERMLEAYSILRTAEQ